MCDSASMALQANDPQYSVSLVYRLLTQGLAAGLNDPDFASLVQESIGECEICCQASL